jgi:hypothetical protein
MKYIFLAAAAATFLGGCASEPQQVEQAQAKAAACRNVDAPTGSRLVRRADCDPATRSANSSDDVRTMQDMQNQTINLGGSLSR